MHAYTAASQFEVEHVHLASVSGPDRVIPVDGDGGGSVHGVRASARQNGHYITRVAYVRATPTTVFKQTPVKVVSQYYLEKEVIVII